MNKPETISVAPDVNQLGRVMCGLKARLAASLSEIVGASEVAYVDYALHGNTGDLVILTGAMEFFKSALISVRTYDNVYSAKFDELKRLPKHIPIVCHGGGNFGDLYPAHQNFREKLVTELPDRKIIVFPQSIHFSGEDAVEKSAAIFRRHPNFHLCVRDHESVETGRLFTPNLHLVPDCAHILWGKFAPRPAASGRLKFMRIDKESAGLAGGVSVDWETLSSPGFYKMQRFIQNATKKLGRRPSTTMSKVAFRLWTIEVNRTLNEAYAHFSRVESVETDRLHGMLFSLLLQKKVVFHDNSVKKLTRYKRAWFEELSSSWVTEARSSFD